MACETIEQQFKNSFCTKDYASCLGFLKQLEEKHIYSEEKLRKYRFYSLYQLEKFEEICQLFDTKKEETRKSLGQDFLFYYAYALYKLNLLLKSLHIVQCCRYALRGLPAPTTNLPLSFSDIHRESEDERLAVLEAQLLYRLGLYHQSFQLYSLLVNQKDGYVFAVNLEACRSFLAQSKQKCPNELSSFTGYELYYNRACTALNCQDYLEAEELLDYALELSQSKDLEDNINPDLQNDIILIQLQKAFLHQVRNFHEEALQTYRDVYKNSVVLLNGDLDPSVIFCIVNNVAVIEKNPSNIPVLRACPPWFVKLMLVGFESTVSQEELHEKILRSCKQSGYRSSSFFKLSSHQLIFLMRNFCIKLLSSNAFSQVEQFLLPFAPFSLILSTLLIFVQIKQEKYKAAAQWLHKVSNLHENFYFEYNCFALTLLIQNKEKKCINGFLQNLNFSKFLTSIPSHGLESFLYFLRFFNKSFPKYFNQLLIDATSVMKDTKQGPLLNFSAAFALGKILYETKDLSQAVQWYAFAATLGENKEKRLALAGQMGALAHYDILQAQNLLKHIQQECILSPERLNEIDPDDVEQKYRQKNHLKIQNPVSIMYSKFVHQSLFLNWVMESIYKDCSEQQDSHCLQMERRKRQRKKFKHPVTSTTLPDPERWLPLRERQSYKKLKKMTGKISRSCQGSVHSSGNNVDTTTKKASTCNVEARIDIKRRVNRRHRK
ncbi:uncharacterized protein LOC128883968 [Hylaeus volcanicus]|uniref:uncharacterized protein LOC128883968 n=1 Tax=Hylaeus volcanicus TaxID=313075 RepID=UPI0023B81A55|nr:uncharacterized protein LOC128883968 [Hylaeus volcanicus]